MFEKYFFQLKKLRFKQVIYPVISVAFFAMVVFVFAKSAVFLSLSINKMFLATERASEAEAQKIDLESYFLVAKKLNLPEIVIAPSPEVEVSPELSKEPEASFLVSPEPPLPPEDKTLLKIVIYNSTLKPGLAGLLKTSLVDAGFSVAKTGNLAPPKETTLLQVKPSKKSYQNSLQEILELVNQSYQPESWQELDEAGEFDVVIVIGEK
ncbi:MAG: hypothetical protein UX26_C0002G0019 [Parcubacteria group bacterium GW2011_GWC1_45_9]|nr:MAG: hypothetical protein UW85_C0004G0007 [Parcubacteria group bacterium GW2011_GWA1_Parcubacteria_45_10]KKT89168.1 MAG: hypothetical protein UW89_C0002G0018 [Parcubacteria group bacterium GW2011_GWB1_45_10]KKU17363.1 MAG: hypothetical protein UX26_C0002G0019 [Parcubacteria group bacterium GW2011_GWC1_45_9]